MRVKSFALFAAAGLALAACGETMGGATEMDPITRAVSGNTLTRGDTAIEVNTDGTLGGHVRGTWTVSNGQWCDTIIEPEEVAGTTCMGVELGDGELTFINDDGTPGNTWQIS